MFNVSTIVESIRRHLAVIVIVVVLAIAACFGSAMTQKTVEMAAPRYTAETTVYITTITDGQEAAAQQVKNIQSDARYVVVSDAVAGEVRRSMGSDITITSPFWMDEEKNSRFYTYFIFIDVSAESPELALDAANYAAELACQEMEEVLPIDSAVVADEAYLTNSSMSAAADRGQENVSNQVTETGEVVVEETSFMDNLSMKTLVIYVFVALFLSIFCFSVYDILSRRVRSTKDVERMLDIAVIGSIKAEEDALRIASAAEALMKNNDLSSVIVAGASQADDARDIAHMLIQNNMHGIVSSTSLASDANACSELLKADCVLLVLREGAAKGSEIEEACKVLRIADVPVLGAVFVSKQAAK